MTPDKSVWARTAYVRTIQNQVTGPAAAVREEYWRFLAQNVHQWKEARHRYIFGVCSVADETVLDFMIDCLGRDSTWYEPGQPRVEPRDLSVYIPENATETKAMRSLQQRLDNMGILHVVGGTTAEDCDEAMLLDSNYVLDQLTWSLAYCRDEIYLGNLYRHGMQTAKDGKFDYSEVRLRDKQGYYSFRELSGQRRPRGESYYRCPFCDGKCKRRRPCEVTGKSQEIESWRGHWRPPPNGDEKWRELTSRDLIIEYNRTKDKSSWRSTEMFSGI